MLSFLTCRPVAVAATILLLAAPGSGSGVEAGGPSPAYFFDPATGSVRTLVGFPGAAIAGPPILTELDGAAVAPGGRAAITLRSGAAFWIRNLGPSPVSQELSGMNEGADRMVWAGNGACVFVYSSTSAWIQRICDSPAGATAEPAVSLAGRLETIRAVAVDFMGVSAAVAGTSHHDTALYLVSSTGGDRLLARAASISAVAFRQNGSLLFATDSDGAILELSAADAYGATQVVAEPGSTTKLVSLIATESGELIVLENEGRSLAAFAQSGYGTVRRQTLDAQANGLQRVHPNIYIATCSGPLGLIDPTRAELIFFVPEN